MVLLPQSISIIRRTQLVHVFWPREKSIEIFMLKVGAVNHLLHPISVFINVVDDGYLLYKLVAPKLPRRELA